MFNTPITLFIYKRPEKTKLVFQKIKKIKPKKIFIVADGPKDNNEALDCQKTREIIKEVDWKCEIFTNFSDNNLGLKKRFFSGINWVFSYVDKSIFLEDDTLPNDHFFPFCENLLQKYENNEDIGMIAGSNMGLNIKDYSSYSFLYVCFIWGWATWKRSWLLNDYHFKNFDESELTKKLANMHYNKKSIQNNLNFFFDIKNNKINSWCGSFVFSMLYHQKLNIVPHQNMITNIGFDTKATHTRNIFSLFNKIKNPIISDKINHPPKILLNKDYLKKILKIHNLNKFEQIFYRILKLINVKS